jgi:hypothetical protein
MERPASEPLVGRLRVGFASVTHSIRGQGRDEVRFGDTPKVRAGPAFCTRDACAAKKICFAVTQPADSSILDETVPGPSSPRHGEFVLWRTRRVFDRADGANGIRAYYRHKLSIAGSDLFLTHELQILFLP